MMNGEEKMMRKMKLFMIVLLLVMTLSACSMSDVEEGQNTGENDDEGVIVLLDSVLDRKIIYSVDTEFYATDLDVAVSYVEGLLLEEDWFDQQNIYNNSAYFVFRIKTDRLDTFVNQLKAEYTLTSFSKTATDISLNYQDTANKITGYQEERARLIVLYESASLTDMITINTRISQIDIELGELMGTLNQFDSLVEYSRVELSIHSSYVSNTLPFGARLINGFVNGFFSLVDFFDGLLIVLVTLIPWAVILVPSGYGVYILVHRRTLRLEKLRQEKRAQQQAGKSS
jgi:hypothetical protein